ncbi:polysialyltransferase family glycosyltransferase [Allostreptomyces psammosilenae]|uniref:Capsule polysaccharide biosynthesis protein n=1 Tax=Allostreptomyces psammosilenae TaxID=1892865 RepID=A0A853A644_9ACTN|nr:polysialyltransferase family glycosyltransferase [Allostreptomyces psammosilenae]NYI06008.1 hypothetical protein [Allostreptomyces psammosilenae]
MIRIAAASTLYGAATVAAALDAGMFGEDRPGDRTILLVCNNVAVPEITPALDEMPGFEALRPAFDAVVSWNQVIRPYHPSGWSPRADDCVLWERAFRRELDLGDEPVELLLESIQVNPARAIAAVFPDAPVEVYADGLMSYGPTRDKLPPSLHRRIRRLLYLDLAPGLRPLLLSEYQVPAETVPLDAVRKVLAEVTTASAAAVAAARPVVEEGAQGPALLLGQYLAALDILTPQEEEELHVRMVRGAVAAGHRNVVFKPHPSAPERYSRALEEAASAAGATLSVYDQPVLAEVLYETLRPGLVVGCFSTALLTAAALYDIPVARVGTELLFERLTPYENSNRIPVVVVDTLVPDLGDPQALRRADGGLLLDEAGTVDRLAPLVRAVGYCMRSEAYPHLREETIAWLNTHLPAEKRYFKRRRLTALELPGGLPVRARRLRKNPVVRKVAMTVRNRF